MDQPQNLADLGDTYHCCQKQSKGLSDKGKERKTSSSFHDQRHVSERTWTQMILKLLYIKCHII